MDESVDLSAEQVFRLLKWGVQGLNLPDLMKFANELSPSWMLRPRIEGAKWMVVVDYKPDSDMVALLKGDNLTQVIYKLIEVLSDEEVV